MTGQQEERLPPAATPPTTPAASEPDPAPPTDTPTAAPPEPTAPEATPGPVPEPTAEPAPETPAAASLEGYPALGRWRCLNREKCEDAAKNTMFVGPTQSEVQTQGVHLACPTCGSQSIIYEGMEAA